MMKAFALMCLIFLLDFGQDRGTECYHVVNYLDEDEGCQLYNKCFGGNSLYPDEDDRDCRRYEKCLGNDIDDNDKECQRYAKCAGKLVYHSDSDVEDDADGIKEDNCAGKGGNCKRRVGHAGQIPNRPHPPPGSCPKTKCEISIPKETEPGTCKLERNSSITASRQFYKLTVEGETRVITFPFESIPWLNQTRTAVAYHTYLDPIDVRWLTLFSALLTGFNNTLVAMKAAGAIPSFDSIQDYVDFFHAHNENIKALGAYEYFSNPAMETPYTDIFENDFWDSDEMFVQKRLAGPCPFTLKLVNMEGSVGMKWQELEQLLNPEFDFKSAIEQALGGEIQNLAEAVEHRLLYVLYHKENNDMETTQPDPLSGLELVNMTSPIALFVKTKSGELKIAAIQMDYKSDSAVYTPSDTTDEWWKAKTMVNLADANYCGGFIHLGHVHLAGSVYCAIFRSHLSELHPLHQIMRYHCDGTTPHIATVWTSLLLPYNTGHLFFSLGYLGFTKLGTLGYADYSYGRLAYDEMLKVNGLDDDGPQRIEYYPFRDDGKLLWTEFGEFAKAFVDMYYMTDSDVQHDTELQSFANEVSSDGKTAPYGGRGKVSGFPSSFETKGQLETFVTRFIWLTAAHASCNYPLEPWQTFVPPSPLKLYRNDGSRAAQLPDETNVRGITVFGVMLGNLRINRIMDHYDKMRDPKLRDLVERCHDQLHFCVQAELEKRNAERKAKQQMGFQYYEPKWLPNSVHV